MNCKSCNHEIEERLSYCASCGAKVINSRLTLKGTWREFANPFFSWDNNLWKTLQDLTLRPELVLGAYVDGARKKYFKPFPFLILYATLALLYYKWVPTASYAISSSEVSGPGAAYAAKFNEVFVGYFNFFTILTIPILAFMSWVSISRKRANFAEHLVFQSYLQPYMGYFTLLIQYLFYLFSDDGAIYSSGLAFLIYFGYSNYAFIRYFNLNWKQSIKINLRFIGLLFLALIILMVFILIGTAIYQGVK